MGTQYLGTLRRRFGRRRILALGVLLLVPASALEAELINRSCDCPELFDADKRADLLAQLQAQLEVIDCPYQFIQPLQPPIAITPRTMRELGNAHGVLAQLGAVCVFVIARPTMHGQFNLMQDGFGELHGGR